MRTYARVVDGVVEEILSLPDDVKIEESFHLEIAATLYDVTGIDPPVRPGWLFALNVFQPGAPPQPLPLPKKRTLKQELLRQLAEAMRLAEAMED